MYDVSENPLLRYAAFGMLEDDGLYIHYQVQFITSVVRHILGFVIIFARAVKLMPRITTVCPGLFYRLYRQFTGPPAEGLTTNTTGREASRVWAAGLLR